MLVLHYSLGHLKLYTQRLGVLYAPLLTVPAMTEVLL
jgi:hypothetical protein